MNKYKSNKQIANNSIVNTILSNYINIWKVYSHTLPKILYFDLIFRINIVLLYINCIYSIGDRIYFFGDRVFTEFFSYHPFPKLLIIRK